MIAQNQMRLSGTTDLGTVIVEGEAGLDSNHLNPRLEGVAVSGGFPQTSNGAGTLDRAGSQEADQYEDSEQDEKEYHGVSSRYSAIVWLERLAMVTRQTWVLVCPAETITVPSGFLTVDCAWFRERVVYVGESYEVPPGSVVYRVGSIQMGSYRIDLAIRYCTCPSYRYIRTGTRHCKHLNRVCAAQTVVKYTKSKPRMQLLSEHVPAKAASYREWIFSQKYDGIRIRVAGTVGWTRGGVELDLSSIWTPPPSELVYDGELCMVAPELSTHSSVMAQVMSGRFHRLRLVLFDLVDATRTCGERLLQLWSQDLPPEHVVRYRMVHLWKAVPFYVCLESMQIGSPECEGVVVRNPGARYDLAGRISNQVGFKIKKSQWAILQQKVSVCPLYGHRKRDRVHVGTGVLVDAGPRDLVGAVGSPATGRVVADHAEI
jgi:hypothetical protein